MNTQIPCIDLYTDHPPIRFSRYQKLEEKLRKHRRELILFCHHTPTISAGVQSKKENLLIQRDDPIWEKEKIDYVRCSRAGDHTVHEEGQLVIYPNLDLDARRIKIGDYFHKLISITGDLIKEVWNIQTEFHPSHPGLYTLSGAKLLSIGLTVKSGFVTSGVALNLSNTRHLFDYIHPCGIKTLAVTGIDAEGGDVLKSRDFILRMSFVLTKSLSHEHPLIRT